MPHKKVLSFFLKLQKLLPGYFRSIAIKNHSLITNIRDCSTILVSKLDIFDATKQIC